jgi:glycosyltransferase involved in cell wall biosynthesis
MPDTSSSPSRPRLSAIITTFNEEHNIVDCIRSLEWCDEIMVVDSYSTDRTCELIRQFPAVKLQQRVYHGSAAQKNWAIERAAYDWILIFDADERCTAKLRDEIQALLRSGPEYDSYTIRRRVYFFDKKIRFSGWQHDEVVRLFRRGRAYYPNRRVHADMITSGPAPRLRNSLDHYMVYDLAEYIQRLTKYGIWGAAQHWKEGRRSGVFQFLGRPIWRFFRTYILQLGVLDGYHGMIFCALQAYSTFVKWSVLWSWHVVRAMGREPDLPSFDDSQQTWAGAEALEASQSRRV